MTKLTKKYIFERKLAGKPIILYINKGFAGWATKEDAELLHTYGIIIPYKDNQVICTHKILTYMLPFDPLAGPVAGVEKGEFLGRTKKTPYVVDS